jgi:phosphate starvation-inducible protein PhoH and related proteins
MEKSRNTRPRGGPGAGRGLRSAAAAQPPDARQTRAAPGKTALTARTAGGTGNAVLRFTADEDNQRLAHLTGALETNLRQIENEYGVRIRRRGHVFGITGSAEAARAALSVLERLHEQAQRPVSLEDVQLQVFEQRRFAGRGTGGDAPRETRAQSAGLGAAASEFSPDGAPAPALVLRTRRPELHARTPVQGEYLQSILAHDISFGIGPAGTGKTYLAVACAADALERDAVERIVLTRPAVEAGERLGFLPGDLAQKVDPYLRPLYDALFDLLGFDKTQKLLERQTIEIAPLAYMRGRTLNHSFVILDEAQNTTPEQMKMFLTRIGFGSKAVITGDVTQTDLPRGASSGLIEAQHVLHGVRGIGFTYFTAADVVRHPLVARIVEAYERASANAAKHS